MHGVPKGLPVCELQVCLPPDLRGCSQQAPCSQNSRISLFVFPRFYPFSNWQGLCWVSVVSFVFTGPPAPLLAGCLSWDLASQSGDTPLPLPPLCQDQTPCSTRPSAPLPLGPAVPSTWGPPRISGKVLRACCPVDFSSPSALVGIKDKNEFYLFF